MGFDFDLPPSLHGCAVTTKLALLWLLTSAGVVVCCCDPSSHSNFTATFPRNAEDTPARCRKSQWKEVPAGPLTLIIGSQGSTAQIKLCTAPLRNAEWIILTRHCWLIRHYFCPRWNWNPRHPFDSVPMQHINYISSGTFATHRTVPPASLCMSTLSISASSALWFGHVWNCFKRKDSSAHNTIETRSTLSLKLQHHNVSVDSDT